MAFGRNRANIGQADIKEVLRAFNINDGWSKITLFAGRMGLAPISLQEDFQSASARRHLAAHVASSEAALGDLQNFPAQAIGIAAGFDALMSRASYYGDVERGERNVSLANILKIADALEMPASQILARAETLLRKRR